MGVLPGRTARFEAFVAPARARPAALAAGRRHALAAALWLGGGAADLRRSPAAASRPRGGCSCSTSPSFAGLILGVALAARLLHGAASHA